MGTAVYRLALHTKHQPNTLIMKAFVAAVASLAVSVNTQVAIPYQANPYIGGPVTPEADGSGQVGVPAGLEVQHFHAQDEFGNVEYGYKDENSAKHEIGNAQLGVSGGYTYIDANNKLQTVSYTAGALGFQAKGTNNPVDTEDVIAVKEILDYAAKYAASRREKRSTNSEDAASAPLGVPVGLEVRHYQAQDEFGNVEYGYKNVNSAKHEIGNAQHGLSGGYSYVDGNNELQTVSYTADGRGFLVQGTNLPTFNPAPQLAPLDTADVAAAKVIHDYAKKKAQAFAATVAREKRSAPPASTKIQKIKSLEVKAQPLTFGAYTGTYGPVIGSFAPHYLGAPLAPLGYMAPFLTPAAAPLKAVVAAAPGAAEATLTKIKLTPGHAIAYRID